MTDKIERIVLPTADHWWYTYEITAEDLVRGGYLWAKDRRPGRGPGGGCVYQAPTGAHCSIGWVLVAHFERTGKEVWPEEQSLDEPAWAADLQSLHDGFAEQVVPEGQMNFEAVLEALEGDVERQSKNPQAYPEVYALARVVEGIKQALAESAATAPNTND